MAAAMARVNAPTARKAAASQLSNVAKPFAGALVEGHLGEPGVGVEPPRIDDQGVAFPAGDAFAGVGAVQFLQRRVFAAVEIDHTELVFKTADHVNRRRHLNHRDRPHARHDDRHAGRIALADPVAIVLAFFLRRFAFCECLGALADELWIGWT